MYGVWNGGDELRWEILKIMPLRVYKKGSLYVYVCAHFDASRFVIAIELRLRFFSPNSLLEGRGHLGHQIPINRIFGDLPLLS